MTRFENWVVLGLITVVGCILAFRMLSMVYELGINALNAALHLHGLR